MLSNDGEQCRNRGQVSGVRCQGTGVRGQVLGFRRYSLLIIKHSLSIEKIFIRTLSSNLEYAGGTVITTDILISFSLFRFGIYNAQ